MTLPARTTSSVASWRSSRSAIGPPDRFTGRTPPANSSHAPVGATGGPHLENPERIHGPVYLERLAAMTPRPEANYPFSPVVEKGGLTSYGPRRADLHRFAAVYVDKILRGAQPSDLPVQQLTRFELVINMKTAKALSLAVPQSLPQRAGDMFE